MDVQAQPVAIGHYYYYETDALGRGYSSVVYKGVDTKNGEFVAVKVIDMRQLKD